MSSTKISSPYKATNGKKEGERLEVKHSSEQSSKHCRKMNGIQAFKILDVTDAGIVIRLPQEFGENATTEVPLTDETRMACAVGRYVDITLQYTVHDGRSTSFELRFWGFTPEEFCHQNGEEIK